MGDEETHNLQVADWVQGSENGHARAHAHAHGHWRTQLPSSTNVPYAEQDCPKRRVICLPFTDGNLARLVRTGTNDTGGEHGIRVCGIPPYWKAICVDVRGAQTQTSRLKHNHPFPTCGAALDCSFMPLAMSAQPRRHHYSTSFASFIVSTLAAFLSVHTLQIQIYRKRKARMS